MNIVQNIIDTGLTEILESEIITKSEFQQLDKIKEGIEESWNYQHRFRTETEMRVSVLNDTRHPTPGMKYLQARREQNVHFTELIKMAIGFEEIKGKILELEGRLEKLQNKDNDKIVTGKIKQIQAQIRLKKIQMIEMRKVAENRIREVLTWEKIKQELDDDSFDKFDLDSIQREGYPIRWKRELISEKDSSKADGSRIATLRGELSAMMRPEKE